MAVHRRVECSCGRLIYQCRCAANDKKVEVVVNGCDLCKHMKTSFEDYVKVIESVVFHKTTCTGCDGKGEVHVRVHMIIKGQRVCVDEYQACPICKGTAMSTQEEVDTYMNDLSLYKD